jgi:hypothetical protein
VIAVLLYAFGLSLRKTSGFFWVLSEPLSKCSGLKKVEASRRSQAGTKRSRLMSGVVWWQSNLCVAVDAYTRQPGSASH